MLLQPVCRIEDFFSEREKKNPLPYLSELQCQSMICVVHGLGVVQNALYLRWQCVSWDQKVGYASEISMVDVQ